MVGDNLSDDTRALWNTYCTAKLRAAAPEADHFDAIELEIALDEFAQALARDMAGSEVDHRAVMSRAMRVTH